MASDQFEYQPFEVMLGLPTERFMLNRVSTLYYPLELLVPVTLIGLDMTPFSDDVTIAHPVIIRTHSGFNVRFVFLGCCFVFCSPPVYLYVSE